MITLKEVLDLFFQMLKGCVESVTLPMGDQLVPTFIYAFVIFVASLISRLLGVVSLVRWQGALIAVILLAILAIIERRSVDEISRLYRVVKSGATALKERAKRPGTAVETDGGTNPGDEMREEGAGPPVCNREML